MIKGEELRCFFVLKTVCDIGSFDIYIYICRNTFIIYLSFRIDK